MIRKPFIKKIKHIKFLLINNSTASPKPYLNQFKNKIKRYPINDNDKKSMIKLFDEFILKWVNQKKDFNEWLKKHVIDKKTKRKNFNKKHIIKNDKFIYGIGYHNRFIMKPTGDKKRIRMHITLYNQHKVSQKIKRKVYNKA